MTTKPISEEQAVHLVRNALLVAGQEMGNGDQWPVVKDTIYKIMKDFEDLKIERDVHAELKKHIYAELDEMDRILFTCNETDRADAAPKLKKLREIYDAYFEPVDGRQLHISDDSVPAHVVRAENLLMSLEGENDA